MKSRIWLFVSLLVAVLIGFGSTAAAVEVPGLNKPPEGPMPKPAPPRPPTVTPGDAAAASEAWLALEELGNAQASLFLTVRQVRVTGLPSVLVHRWRRFVELSMVDGKLPGDPVARVMRVRHAMATFAKFVGVARTDVARAMAPFAAKPKLFGMFAVVTRGLDAALDYVRTLREGREKFEAGAVRTRILANRAEFGVALDKFRKWAEQFDLNRVRTAFYEALLFVTEESEPRAAR